MKCDFRIQGDDLNLANIIEEEMEKGPKKAYLFIGMIKESGFEIVEEYFIDSKAKLTIFMGIDKKNTTKGLLENLLRYTKDIYIYNNNDVKEYEANVYVFEGDKTATIYCTPSNLSEGGIKKDMAIMTRLTFDMQLEAEKKAYKENLKLLLELKNMNFTKLTKSMIEELLENKQIFSNKQYEHSVKSISEFLGKKDTKQEPLQKESSAEEFTASELNIPKIDLNQVEIDIDISDALEEIEDAEVEQEVEMQEEQVEEVVEPLQGMLDDEVYLDEEVVEQDEQASDEVVDLDSMLFTKANVTLNTTHPEPIKEEQEEKLIFKKLDLHNVSNYIFELPAKSQNEQEAKMIKIPNYIRELIPNFFEFEKANNIIENELQYKAKPIKLEVVDVKNSSKVMDHHAKMMQRKGQTYMTMVSDALARVEYEEKDIARIIKLSSDIYHIEIVSREMQEYKIWAKIMTKKLKGVDRKYGIM